MFNPDSDEIGDIISHSVNQNVTIDKLRDLAMEVCTKIFHNNVKVQFLFQSPNFFLEDILR